MADNRADARKHSRRTWTHSGHHIVRATLVRSLTVCKRTDNRHFIRNLSRLDEVLRKPLAWNGCLN